MEACAGADVMHTTLRIFTLLHVTPNNATGYYHNRIRNSNIPPPPPHPADSFRKKNTPNFGPFTSSNFLGPPCPSFLIDSLIPPSYHLLRPYFLRKPHITTPR